MQIEDQVVSLVLSKKLRELGVKQESYFKWEERKGGEAMLFHRKATSCVHKYFSAFTVAELGELLPDWTDTTRRGANDWLCRAPDEHEVIKSYYSFSLKEADARAKMLIYLLENKLI